jgi:hypothetical protein
MKCTICDNETYSIFSAKILNKYDIKYYYCDYCGFLQTEEPYWLQEAYNNPINIVDTGVMARNIGSSKITAVILYFLFDPHGKYLDFAGGYGFLTRLMRDIGFDFYWHDPYSPNLVARGFELETNSLKYELITSFESFEHFNEPIKEIENIIQFSDNILFSTELLPSTLPKPGEWWYYALESGQHISFYSYRTLKYITQKYDMNLYSNGGYIHMFTKNRKINNNLFNFLLKFRRFGLFFYVKKKMKSLTVEDMNFLISKIKNRCEE